MQDKAHKKGAHLDCDTDDLVSQAMLPSTRRNASLVMLCIVAVIGGIGLFSELRAQDASASPSVKPRTIIVALDGTGQFRSIQEAIDQAGPGDTVEVRGGEYAEDVTIHSKERIALIGEGTDRVTILGRNRVGSFHIGKWPYGATDIVVSGITVRQHGGLALGIFNGRGIVLHKVKVDGLLFGQQVQDVRIEDSILGGSDTTGVQFADSQAVLQGNFIHDNDHGVSIAGKSDVRLERNVITRNLFEGVVITDDARAILISNTITKNRGGVAFLGRSRSEVSGNIIGLNETGFLVASTSRAMFSYNGMYNTKENYRAAGPPERPAPELQSGSDLTVDPKFVDSNRDDFRLRADTPLVSLGGFSYLGALAPTALP